MREGLSICPRMSSISLSMNSLNSFKLQFICFSNSLRICGGGNVKKSDLLKETVVTPKEVQSQCQLRLFSKKCVFFAFFVPSGAQAWVVGMQATLPQSKYDTVSHEESDSQGIFSEWKALMSVQLNIKHIAMKIPSQFHLALEGITI